MADYDASMAVAQAEAVIAMATGQRQAEQARDIALVDEAEARARTTELLAFHTALTSHVEALTSRLADLRGGLAGEERQLIARLLEVRGDLDRLEEQRQQLQRMNQLEISRQFSTLRQMYSEPLLPTRIAADAPEVDAYKRDTAAGGPGITGVDVFAPAVAAPEASPEAEPEATPLVLDAEGYPVEADAHGER